MILYEDVEEAMQNGHHFPLQALSLPIPRTNIELVVVVSQPPQNSRPIVDWFVEGEGEEREN